MLHKNSIELCQEMGQDLADRGIALSVQTNSAFYSMINSSVQPLAALESLDRASLESMDVDPIEEVAEAAHSEDHDALQAAVVAQLAAAARYTENHAQNVLIPKVEEALNAVKSYTDSLNVRQTEGFSIVPCSYPSLIDSETLMKTVARWSDFNLGPQPISAIKCEAAPDLAELISTGSTLFDSEVNEFIAQQPEGFVQECFSALMSQGYGHLLNVSDMSVQPRTLVSFLIVLGLYRGLPVGCSVENEATFRADIAHAMAALGNAIVRIVRRREMEIRGGELVYNRISAIKDCSIVVNSDIYAKAKVDGMTDEMLKAAVKFGRSTVVTDLIADGDQLTRMWKSHEATVRIAEEEGRYDLVLRAMSIYLRDAIVNAAEGELAMPADEHQLLIRTALGAVPLNVRNNHYKLVRWLVWAVLYPQSDSLAHLDRIDAIVEANPDMDLREAASLALIQYVADWAARQISITKI